MRLNNTTTEEVARNNGVQVGKQLTCTGGGSGGATLSYQWLRNGDPIGGATSATYTTAAADAGTDGPVPGDGDRRRRGHQPQDQLHAGDRRALARRLHPNRAATPRSPAPPTSARC